MNPVLSAFLSRRLIDRRGGHRARALRAWRDLQDLDRDPRETRVAQQQRKLADLLHHAAQRVPFYREQLGSRTTAPPGDAGKILRSLPILTREQVQKNPEALTAEAHGPTSEDATGGSTGTPMRFRVDAATQVAREASLWWADSLSGWSYGERIAMLWGSNRDVRGAAAGIRSAARWWLDNRRWYNAFDMGPDRMDQYHAELEAFRPHLLVAYAGSVHLFARHLRARGLSPGYPLRGIVSSAERLLPGMRQQVEEVFSAPVFDRYGNREAGAIAAECSAHQGLHVNEGQFIVEISSRDPFREPGPILITYLENRAMPFIRYDTGDLGCWLSEEPCACGRTSIRLAPVVGRQGDTIRTAGGKWIHGEFFTHLFYGERAVDQFQFVQESLTRYTLRVVAGADDVARRRPAWELMIREAVGADAVVEVERVERIPLLPSGKRAFTISRVGSGRF